MYSYLGISIRCVEDRDLELMRQLRNDPSTWMMLTEPAFLDTETQRQWFSRVRKMTDRCYYILCDKGHDFIGIVRTDEIDNHNRSIRIGVDISPDLRGKGFGNKAYELLKSYCFCVLNMHRVWLAVLDINTVAIHLYEKVGFKVEGRYRSAIFRGGKYHDYVLMSILEDEYRKGEEHRPAVKSLKVKK